MSNYLNLSVYKTGDTLGTIGLLTGNIIVSLLIKGSTLAFHFFLYQFKLFDLISIIPIWMHWVLTFIFIDFANDRIVPISSVYSSYGIGMRLSNQNTLFNVNYGIPNNSDSLISGKLHFEIISKFVEPENP